MPDYQAEQIKPMWKLPFEGAAWPMAVALAGSHRRVVAGNQDGVLLSWELPEATVAAKVKDENGKEVDGFESPPPTRQLLGHTNTITRCVVAGDGKTLITTSYDRTVCLWDLDAAPSGENEIVLDRESRERAAKRVEEKKRADILNAPGVKVATLAPVAKLSGHKDWVNALHLSANGERFITGDDSGLVIVWDVKSRKEISRWQCPGIAWVSSVALSPDGALAIVAQYRRKGGDWNNYPAGLRIYNVADGTLKLDILATLFPKEKNPPYQYQYEYHKLIAHGLVAADWSPDGKLVAMGQGGEEGDGKVQLIDVETGKVVRAISGHQYGITDVRFTRDGKHLFSAGRDTMFRIVQVDDGKEVAKVGKSRGGQFFDWLSAISLSPDEKWLAATDISGHVQIWQL